MRITFAIAGILATSTTTAVNGLDVCTAMDDDDESCSRTSRIVGGNEVCPAFKYPHLVPLGQQFGNSFSQFCGATLYNSEYVITAAHCVDGDNSGLAIQVHRHDLTTDPDDEGVETILADFVVSHPSYNGNTLENDIAVIKLANPVSSYAVEQVTLDDGSYLTDGQMLTVAGWGTLSSGGSQPDVPHEVDVPYIPYDECIATNYAASDIDEDTMICAGNINGGQDSCQGDSGGPLFVHCDDDSVVLVGVVSWGIGCASSGYPGVYSRVSTLSGFVDDVLAGVYDNGGGGSGDDDDDDGDLLDCAGNDYTGFEHWVGDSFCDDGTWGLYFNCDEFSCDDGDCACTTGTTTEESTTTTEETTTTTEETTTTTEETTTTTEETTTTTEETTTTMPMTTTDDDSSDLEDRVEDNEGAIAANAQDISSIYAMLMSLQDQLNELLFGTTPAPEAPTYMLEEQKCQQGCVIDTIEECEAAALAVNHDDVTAQQSDPDKVPGCYIRASQQLMYNVDLDSTKKLALGNGRYVICKECQEARQLRGAE